LAQETSVYSCWNVFICLYLHCNYKSVFWIFLFSQFRLLFLLLRKSVFCFYLLCKSGFCFYAYVNQASVFARPSIYFPLTACQLRVPSSWKINRNLSRLPHDCESKLSIITSDRERWTINHAVNKDNIFLSNKSGKHHL
jgi:hypothetical protein